MRQRNVEIVGCRPNALRALGRRSFLQRAAAALGLSTLRVPAEPLYANTKPIGSAHVIRLFLTGDVMTGRGIDQVLPNPVDPRIYEPYMKSAAGYVELAERRNGPISKPVDFAYIWGDALRELERAGPDVRIINLETSVTVSEDHSPKGINYRMHPKNVPCLQAAGIDVCLLANNHVLDWGPSGLIETLETLRAVDLKTAGAGRDAREALAPAVVEISGKGRVIVFAFGAVSSGIPRAWAAAADRPGVNLLPDLSQATVGAIGAAVKEVKRTGDVAVASLHWGGNWGYQVTRSQQEFAHGLIDDAGIDMVHGHSSHHVKGIEVYGGKPILYGCGDFLTDYEGIGGYEEFRDDLVLMYFPAIDPATGLLQRLDMTPLRLRNFRLNHASAPEAWWLEGVLNGEGRRFGTGVERDEDNRLTLRWA